MPDIQYYLDRGLSIEEAKKRVADDVFGVGFKKGPGGRPIEQGLGSPGHPTAASVAAYEKYGKDEEGYKEKLVGKKKELADYNARRNADANA